MQDRTPQYEHNRESEGKRPSSSDYNTPTTTPSPAAPPGPSTSTPGREINPPPSQYPKPEPVAGKDSDKRTAGSSTNIDDIVNEASEESFPASDPPASHHTD